MACLAVLFLIAAGMFLAVMPSPSPVPAPVRLAEGPQFPEPQVRFCDYVEIAAREYRDLSQQSKDEKNGIVQKRLMTKMTTLYRERDVNVFRAAEASKFRFEEWAIVVSRIHAPDKGTVSVDFKLRCSQRTTVHATIVAEPKIVDFLATLSQGSRLNVTGRFVERFGIKTDGSPVGPPESAEKFEQSFTEGGSMTEPEYSAVLTAMTK